MNLLIDLAVEVEVSTTRVKKLAESESFKFVRCSFSLFWKDLVYKHVLFDYEDKL
jgi:hypothetical protein